MRVLLVEDDPAVASGVRDGLAANGYTVDYVSNGTSALAAAASEPLPDIILLDLGLPDMDGQDVCRSIRADSQIPIIVISAPRQAIWHSRVDCPDAGGHPAIDTRHIGDSSPSQWPAAGRHPAY